MGGSGLKVHTVSLEHAAVTEAPQPSTATLFLEAEGLGEHAEVICHRLSDELDDLLDAVLSDSTELLSNLRTLCHLPAPVASQLVAALQHEVLAQERSATSGAETDKSARILTRFFRFVWLSRGGACAALARCVVRCRAHCNHRT